ncbi:MAG: polysaccharide deacetylase family protein [Lachnospiraceae bacterium]|nr:polysaccharide deacetylase family protein [Lachnospiraceae bacterium]
MTGIMLAAMISLSAAFASMAEESAPGVAAGPEAGLITWDETGSQTGQTAAAEAGSQTGPEAGRVEASTPAAVIATEEERVYSGGPGVVASVTPAPADTGRPMIALTFDDGPSGENTPVILSYLEQYSAKATFFVLGHKAAANASVLQRMVADGCEIGNHTWNHEKINKISAAALTGVLNSTNDAIQAACGVRPTIMRPPGGGYNDAALATVGSLGMSAYYWSIDTRDWEHRNAAKTVETVLNNVRDGDIILMHDIHGCTAESAAVLIPELINRGFQLVTVTELANARGGAQPGQIYFNFR